MLRPALAISAGGAPACCARRLTTRRAHRRDDGRPDGGTLGLRAAIPHQSARRYDGVRRLHQHPRGDARGSPWPPCPGRQGPRRFRRRRVVPRLRKRAATRHFARVRGVGLFRCARPSDVLAVPKKATPATSSTPGGRATRRRGQRRATTLDGVGATIAGRTAHRRRSHRKPACSAGRSARRASPSASASPHRSTSTTGRWTRVCGSMTTVWRASWAEPPPTRLSSVTSPCTSPTRH
jgi:hypothetical protein